MMPCPTSAALSPVFAVLPDAMHYIRRQRRLTRSTASVGNQAPQNSNKLHRIVSAVLFLSKNTKIIKPALAWYVQNV